MFLSKYENVYICAVLFSGEFGEVYKAHFIKFGLTYTVAVKTLKGYLFGFSYLTSKLLHDSSHLIQISACRSVLTQ